MHFLFIFFTKPYFGWCFEVNYAITSSRVYGREVCIKPMTTVIIILLIAAIALFVISFLQKGDNKQLEKELEDVAAQWMQENFELKQRISELEKAMKMDSPSIEAEHVPDSPKVRELMKKQVITLYTSGIVTSEIAEQSSLPKEEVEKIIEEYLKH